MARFLQPRQINRAVKRGVSTIVATVEQQTHATGEGTVKMWRNISFFIGGPCIGLAMANCYLRHMEEQEHEPDREFIPYTYMKIMNKPFPWRDGKHSLFHNPKHNYVPGIGFEA